MTGTTPKYAAAVEAYFADLRRIRASGGATGERSSYGPLANLLTAVGATLRPKVFCVQELADQGAGHPDFGLYTAGQVQKGMPRKEQAPERGVVEAKSQETDVWLTAESEQTARYWERYRLVLVTNTRDFVLVGTNLDGKQTKLEALRLADSEVEFLQRLEKPRAFAQEVGASLGEYLARALSHRTALADPKDLAWLLASYARDSLARVEAAGGAPQLSAVRSALEAGLGIEFEGERGRRFFSSTLVQTLFYGIFSAWVLWARTDAARLGPGPLFSDSGHDARFRWREAVWHLRAPVLRALFRQIADPGHLHPLGLTEVLDWTAAALDRVDRTAFFARFNEGEAVPYFYEPFLAAFDPALRKQLGVWYTPSEVVRYMVARVDRALKQDLGIADGLASESVYILDPCCGTGAYLAEVLRRIAANLEGRGLGALTGSHIKQAAMERVFGFEIMPAPLVVAHLQIGLTMQDLDASLADDGTERAGVYLTNALTGWEADSNNQIPFPELAEEREHAAHVKREVPILVILGNPPYNGFAGMAVAEERELSDAYRTTRHVRRPEGQGLNDLYIRFFRMAERRIAETTGQGVVCFISNYSWLDGLSFTGMRERYIEAFDAIRIDCLNGDKYKTGKVAPDGSADPSIFSTESDPVGIQVGTAITTLIRKADHKPAAEIGFRNLWGQGKPETLAATAEAEPDALYEDLRPVLPLGLPFVRTEVTEGWFDWPALPDLLPVSFPGVKTSRDGFLIDVDLDRLQRRVRDYFDADLTDEEIARLYPGVMQSTARFNARATRDTLMARGGPDEAGFVRFAYRPFDTRWIYWEADGTLLDRPRPDYIPHVFEGNLWLEVREHEAKEDFSRGTLTRHLADNFGSGLSNYFPVWLQNDGLGTEGSDKSHRPNLSNAALRYLECMGLGVEDLFFHILATLHDPAYRRANAGALRMEWPRIPLPNWGEGGNDDATATLLGSAAQGRELARLLDSDMPVPGVTVGTLRPDLATIAVPATTDGHNMTGDDFAVTAGWGHFGSRSAVMPGQGKIVKRTFSHEESLVLDDALTAGDTTLDVHLNPRTFWRNVPTVVWQYKLGGYQVLKKWLSYREHAVLGRRLKPEEVQHFTDTARRIAAILTM